jgi:hypothetical protein
MDTMTYEHRFGHYNRFIGTTTVTPEPADLPDLFSTGALLGFTAEEARHQIAVHEAAHFVAFQVCGYTPLSLSITQAEFLRDEGGNEGWGASGANKIETIRMPLPYYLVCLAAGERGEFRHMAEQGTDSQVRRWCTEVNNAFGDGSDRSVADAAVRQSGYKGLTYDRRDTSEASWFLAQDDADKLLDDHWGAVNRLADSLLVHGKLSRRKAAALTGI